VSQEKKPVLTTGPGCVKTLTLSLRVEFLDFVIMETIRTDNFSWKNAIEKTILRVLGSREFSHSLDP
jgi:hypothetical protein